MIPKEAIFLYNNTYPFQESKRYIIVFQVNLTCVTYFLTRDINADVAKIKQILNRYKISTSQAVHLTLLRVHMLSYNSIRNEQNIANQFKLK